MKNPLSKPHQASVQWSNRILIASLVVIICLTLFPFRIDFAAPHPFRTSPFLLGTSEKVAGHFDFLFNVLLFVPFGFGLSAKLRKRGSSGPASLLLVIAAGAITSYVVEFLQLFIETRNSGWDDIISNSAGAAVGFLLLDRWGEPLSQRLSGWEERVETFFSLRRVSIVLLLYLGLSFIISIPLQKETRLSNWDTNAVLLVGSDGTSQYVWRGQVFRIQIWDRAIPEEPARKLTAGEPAPGTEAGILASYEFTGPPPYEDRQRFLPALAWMSPSPPAQDAKSLNLDGNSWLSSVVPVAGLTQQLKRTNQFAVRAVCAPADFADPEQLIVSISTTPGIRNLTLRREGTQLVVWSRNPLSVRRALLAWYIPGVFAGEQVRDILVSYDGSNISVYVNGKRVRQVYYLSPGAALAHRFKYLLTSELDGYLVVYDVLIFVAAGMLLGMIARNPAAQKSVGRSLLFLGLFLPPALYEFILVRVSGRALSVWQVSLCVLLTLLGIWLVNGDRRDGVLLRTS
jgi:glycopeptide antibiotics resistance protein